MRTLLLAAISSMIFLSSIGCTTSRISNTARTGTEQLLLSNAVDQTLDKMALPPLEGKKVFLDPQYLDSVDKGYIVGSMRQRLLAHGAMLQDAKEGSDVTIEICSGGVGTDDVDSYMGMPGIALPGPLPVQLPEVRLYEKKSQFGTAKINVVAFSTDDGRLIYDSGTNLARSDDSNWSIMGVGPFQSGSVRDEVKASTAPGLSTFSGLSRSANSSGNSDTINR
jgi:hypothetical protein